MGLNPYRAPGPDPESHLLRGMFPPFPLIRMYSVLLSTFVIWTCDICSYNKTPTLDNIKPRLMPLKVKLIEEVKNAPIF